MAAIVALATLWTAGSTTSAADPGPGQRRPATIPEAASSEPLAPLPGSEWNDPDSVNWADVPGAERGPLRARLFERRGDRVPLPVTERLRERLRGDLRGAGGRAGGNASGPERTPDASIGWPDPAALRAQLGRLTAVAPAVGAWATATLSHLAAVLATAGPSDAAAAAALLPLSEDVDAGMALADRLDDAGLATDTRRAALAVARRVAVWRAAGGGAATARLLAALERFESAPTATAASTVHDALDALGVAGDLPATAVGRAVSDHYLAPNLRVAVRQEFLAGLLPDSTVSSGPMQDYVLGRQVRGTRRIEQSTGVRFVPDPDEIRVELLVDGVVTSRSVAESGPVAIHSRGTAEFAVRKPVTISAAGIAVGRAVGTASNQSRLADIRTDFDAVPIMGPLMRSIARNQHDERYAEAIREVNDKIISRACREVDSRTEPKLREAAERVRTRLWQPLVGLGLEPRAVGLETTAEAVTARIRLAGPGQLAAHTPRPRAPDDALFSVQIHESSLNNACARLELAGRRLTVEGLVRHVCGSLNTPPRIADDLPGEVEVAFASQDPLRVECRDGLVRVRMKLDAIESGRRAWYDIAAGVDYRLVASGAQVFLEREGPVRLSGAGQQGRMELALRTIFGKIFPKERPVPLLPAALVGGERLEGLRAVQAASTDGWVALALGRPAQADVGPSQPTATRPESAARRGTRR